MLAQSLILRDKLNEKIIELRDFDDGDDYIEEICHL
jgi:hypothetical protein